MIQVEKFTTTYSPDQDRLSLDATIRGGATVRLWLTQRLTSRLVPELAKRVKPQHEDAAYAEIMANLSQQRESLQKENEDPVNIDKPEYEWLVTKINVSDLKSGLDLIFFGEEDQQAKLSMNIVSFRRWLSILKSNYTIAGWEGLEWPRWIVPTSVKRAKGVVLH